MPYKSPLSLSCRCNHVNFCVGRSGLSRSASAVGVSFAGVSTRYERIVLVQYSGLTIASGCVKHKIEIPTLGYDEKVKVCNDCHDVIRGAPEAAEN